MKAFLLWMIAFIITLGSAYYQRVTGPTYPIDGTTSFDGKKIEYILPRTHSGQTDETISLAVDDPDIKGILDWKRYKTADEWTRVDMQSKDGKLTASLPGQPPAGKLQYKLTLIKNNRFITIPTDEQIVIRFKGEVPFWILIPHVIFIFGAMFLSTRTGFEVLRKEPKLKEYTLWTVGILIFGGMIFGPLTQLYAFGELWTGVPFGYDLTDNKTLIALIGWLIALWAVYKSKRPKTWVIFAAVLMLLVFLIPHSVLGSELDYNKLDKEKQIKIEMVK
ncbi:MAG: hypothetical protein K8H86_04030 [Ignavibacteriaceae bacterium]|nr:hypothetical protein [Ignavibacteriaceae bacterium]